MVPDTGPILFVSRLQPQCRLVFNCIRRVQEKVLRFSSHLEFLLALKASALIPRGLVVRQHVNTHDDTCSALVQQTLQRTSHALLDIMVLDCCLAVRKYSSEFVALCRILGSLMDQPTYALILSKLQEMGLKLQSSLHWLKSRKLHGISRKAPCRTTTNPTMPSPPIRHTSTTIDRPITTDTTILSSSFTRTVNTDRPTTKDPIRPTPPVPTRTMDIDRPTTIDTIRPTPATPRTMDTDRPTIMNTIRLTPVTTSTMDIDRPTTTNTIRFTPATPRTMDTNRPTTLDIIRLTPATTRIMNTVRPTTAETNSFTPDTARTMNVDRPNSMDSVRPTLANTRALDTDRPTATGNIRPTPAITMITTTMNTDRFTPTDTSRPPTPQTRTRKRHYLRRSKHRSRTKPITNSKNVVNLSSHILSDHEHSILSRGLKFCSTPVSLDRLQLRTDLAKFARRLRLKLYHHKDESDVESRPDSSHTHELLNHPLLKKQSTFTPSPGTDLFLDAYIAAVDADIMNEITPKTYRNITSDEHKALHDLKTNRRIIIKEADKGSSVVIQDREQYIQEGSRQLNDTKYYSKLDHDPTPTFTKDVDKALNKAESIGLIDKELKSALRPRNAKPGRFYTLPKIHKEYDSTPPGRPIISGNGTATEKISLFLDYHLKPLVPKLDSYVQDDMDFLRKLEAIKRHGPLPPNASLVVMDVSGLYTNIPTLEGIAACRSFLEHSMSPEKVDSFCELMEIVLTHNNFVFGEDHYLQISGTSMGTKMAPSMACLFMGVLESQLLSSSPRAPLMWTRYIDDIFFIWTHGPEELDRFLEMSNNFHPSIKFTSESSTKEVPFLDVMVSISDGVLHTDLYSKPTDSHQFLHWTSCHPKHTKRSLPYGLAFRLNRICSTPENLQLRVSELTGFLRDRGYSSRLVTTQISKALSIPRSDALKPTGGSESSLDRVPLVVTYHPSLPAISKIIQRHLSILHSSTKCRAAIPNPPIVAYRRSANLKDVLVRSTLPQLTPPLRGSFPCGGLSCKSCHHKRGAHSDVGIVSLAHTTDTTTFTSSSTGETFPIRKHLTCQSDNVIYLITCATCGKQYVGETGRTMECRVGEHCADARLNRRDKQVGRHFNLPNHNACKISVICIDRPPKNDIIMRKILEKQWIMKLKTTEPHGLNIKE